MKILQPLFLLLLSFSYAIADDKETEKKPQQYDVNIIIFEDAHARYLNAEKWNSTATTDDSLIEETQIKPAADNIKKTEENDTSTDDFTNIKPEILNHEYKRMNRSSEYNVLFYAAWRQTGLDKNNAYEINIEQLKNNHKTTSENNLTGYFKLVLARYLHMYGVLEYHREIAIPATDVTKTEAPATAASLTDGNVENTKDQTFSIDLHRKMRSKTLHYIDHPMVGILIQINPTEAKTDDSD